MNILKIASRELSTLIWYLLVHGWLDRIAFISRYFYWCIEDADEDDDDEEGEGSFSMQLTWVSPVSTRIPAIVTNTASRSLEDQGYFSQCPQLT